MYECQVLLSGVCLGTQSIPSIGALQITGLLMTSNTALLCVCVAWYIVATLSASVSLWFDVPACSVSSHLLGCDNTAVQ